MVDASAHATMFRVLSPLEVLRDGVAVPLGGGRQRALLARLLVSVNELARSDGLIERGLRRTRLGECRAGCRLPFARSPR